MRLRDFVIPVAVASLSAYALPVVAQSLGEVAKKEEERRKTIPQPAKVYTNKDLGPATPATAPAPAPDASKTPVKDQEKGKDTNATENAPGADADSSKGAVKDQAYWAGRRK